MTVIVAPRSMILTSNTTVVIETSGDANTFGRGLLYAHWADNSDTGILNHISFRIYIIHHLY